MATTQAQPARRHTEHSRNGSTNANRRAPSSGGEWSPVPCSPTTLLTGRDIVDMLYDTQIDVFSDIGGECWFRWKELPPELRNEAPPQSRQEQFDCLVPITSRKMRALLNAWLYVDELGQPKPGAMNEAISILEGIAFTNPAACDLETAIETNPVFEALVALLEVEGDWRGMATELLAAMNQLSRERDWHLDRHPNWPRNASQLSRALGKLTDLFEDAGYTYEFRRANGFRHHCFVPIRVSQQKAAPQDKPAQETSSVPRCENAVSSKSVPQPTSSKPNAVSPAVSASPNDSVAPRHPHSPPFGSAASAGVSKPVPTPAPPTLVAKLIEQMCSATSAGSAGDLRVADPAKAPLSKPTDWKRAITKK